MATTTLTIVSNAGTIFQSYVYCIAILLLILHDLYLLFCFWLACLNYPTFCICNQSCIAFIYFLFISCFFRQMEKEPLPQLVEVLSHAAARAATFSVLAAMWTVSQAVTVLGCSVDVSILCSHTDRDWAFSVSVLDFNLMQSRRLLPLTMTSSRTRFIVSILCFQSYIATWATSEFQSYAAFIGCI